MTDDEIVDVFKRYLYCSEANRTCNVLCKNCSGYWTFEMMQKAANGVIERLGKK